MTSEGPASISTDELIYVIERGVKMTIDCSERDQADLLKIAAAAAKGGSHVVMTGGVKCSPNEIVELHLAGGGHVSFAATVA